ncbi:hypothetical protein JMJ35_007338 [Cladonia borealis]|uniref:Uncharacterized protein n=1 Tax=Cladonia borealis TaxID=184061 RepID=A0AA39QXW1_9LECA|nr:hypothetical protein JMJ35_007338 [Cladonia borealis]
MKRKHQGPQTEGIMYTKRSRSNEDDANDEIPTAAQSKIDPTYGQRGAFPGLDDPGAEDDLFYGPASDGLEYLRMVRIEAKTVPNLLVAPSSPPAEQKEESLYQDYPRGYYSDGAYTALPLASSTTHGTNLGAEEEPLDPQEAYYASLLSRFADLSSTLQNPPPATSTALSPQKWWNSSRWRSQILNSQPQTTRLASLPQEQVIYGLEILESLLTLGNLHGTKGRNIGAWAWGLLGRCREVGEMSSEEVGVVRGVGKRAQWILRRMAAGEGLWEEKEVQEEEDGDGDDGEEEDGGGEDGDGEEGEEEEGPLEEGEEDEFAGGPGSYTLDDERALAEARKRIIASLDGCAEPTEPPLGKKAVQDQSEEKDKASIEPRVDAVPRGIAKAEENNLHIIYATLDIIITIIGRCYGQRDLLDGRLLWEEIEWMNNDPELT